MIVEPRMLTGFSTSLFLVVCWWVPMELSTISVECDSQTGYDRRFMMFDLGKGVKPSGK